MARLTALLGNAQWELEQATVRALAEGYVSGLGLAVGDRATPHTALEAKREAVL